MAEPRSTSFNRNGSQSGTGSGDADRPEVVPSGRDEPDDSRPGSKASSKTQWRARLLRARREVPEPTRAAEAGALAQAAAAAARHTGGPVCCYVPMPGEPGSLSMLDALRAAGYQVLLPIVPSDPPDAPPDARRSPSLLSWAPYAGPSSLVAGPYRLRQPVGPGCGPDAIATAGLVLVPALAVDHRGVRLGRGAGWYDRALTLAAPATPLIAVVRDEELVAALPNEPHDILMTGVLTPQGGLRALTGGLD